MPTKIEYNGSVIAEIEGGTAILPVSGKEMATDIMVDVDVQGGGGECDLPHIIEVDVLPTENIDKDSIYLCQGKYYKWSDILSNVVININGAKVDLVTYLTTMSGVNINIEYYYVYSKPTENIKVSNLPFNLYVYFVEDENNIYIYGDEGNISGGEETGQLVWFNLATLFELNYQGNINDISEAVNEGIYTIINHQFLEFATVNGGLKITYNGTFDVTNKMSVIVDVPNTIISGSYEFNEILDLDDFVSVDEIREVSVNFTWVDRQNETGYCSAIGLAKSSNIMPEYPDTVFDFVNCIIDGNSATMYSTIYPNAWRGASRVVNFGTEPQIVNSWFKEWLEANATKQSIQSDLEEITITENGEYSPSEGYDGFSKVTVEVEAVDSPLPIEISTEAEMTALLTSGEVGGVYKYVGETTDAYKQKGVYMLTDFGSKAWMELYVGDPSSVLPPVGTSLEDCTWSEISAISAEGLGEEYFNIGDTKSVHIQGTVGILPIDTTLYVYIIGFNHNSGIEGNGITFGTFKTADGVDVCLADSKYDSSSKDGTKCFNVNHWGNYNYGGWAASDLRYDILGSTDVAPSGYGSEKTTSVVGYDATATCATNPVANTLMAALPADLRGVMKPMTIYTDNTGNKSNVNANVTASVDYLPLLGEYEIFGTRNYANQYEKNKQAQYEYYTVGNSKVKYCHSDIGSTAAWWARSAYYSNNTNFCHGTSNGTAYSFDALRVYGVAPVFKV